MGDSKKDEEFFLGIIPVYNVWYKLILIYLYHLIIFILLLSLFCWAGNKYLLAIIPIQFSYSLGANMPFIYMFKYDEKIREKYLNKFKKLPWQRFFYRYSYSSPCGAAALYTPLLLINYDFLPKFIQLPNHFVTNNLFSAYVSIPLGIIIIILGNLLIKPSQGYDGDMHNYLHIWYPDKNRLPKDGIYQYILHPRFLCRFMISFGIAILANNILAIIVAFTHYMPYLTFMKILDKELIRMYGEDVKEYISKTPDMIPKYGNWKNYLKIIFSPKK